MSTKKRITTEDFVMRAKQVHGNKYDYSKVEYTDCQTKVCIICPEHGEFWQTPSRHINQKCGCPRCANNVGYTTEEFIKRAKKIHGDKYDYSKVNYINRNTKVCIIDKEIGEFWQTPSSHLGGHGPSSGRGKRVWEKRDKITTEEFVKRAESVHGKKYNYKLVEYKSMNEKVKIICNKCGNVFEKTPNNHINQQNGCPKCNVSKLEESVENELIENSIKYIHIANRDNFSWLGRQSLDFYLPDYNIAIECQGIQHYEPVDQYGGNKRLEQQIESDSRKLKLCSENGIKILYFTKYKIEGENIVKNKKELINKIKTCLRKR